MPEEAPLERLGWPIDGLDVVAFATAAELEGWLAAHHESSPWVWVRLGRPRSSRQSVTFHDLLALGLCFGWSESTRRTYDDDSYLQRFTPRRQVGTTSERNRHLVNILVAEGRVRPADLAALRIAGDRLIVADLRPPRRRLRPRRVHGNRLPRQHAEYGGPLYERLAARFRCGVDPRRRYRSC